MLEPLFFYLFATLTVFFAALVVGFQNTMYGVFSLIMTFLSVAGLFLMAGAEFLAMVLVVVYVGAVAVFFLFVVMMLGKDLVRIKKRNLLYIFFGSGLCLALATMLYLLLGESKRLNEWFRSAWMLPHESNTHALGKILYTTYSVPLLMTGLILFVALIGAVSLMLRKREDVRRQSMSAQSRRSSHISLVSVPIGKENP